jgi:PAS domain S-box-containing protein
VSAQVSRSVIDLGIPELQESLLEAADLCRAVSAGEVDAFVVGPEANKQVLLLTDAFARYRQLVEDMRQGAVTLSGAGDVLFANRSFAAMVGAPLAEVFRARMDEYVVPADRARLPALLRARPAADEGAFRIVRRDGAQLTVRFSLVSAGDDMVTYLVTDLTSLEQRVEQAQDVMDAIQRGAVDALVIGNDEIVMLDREDVPYRLIVERMTDSAVTVSRGGEIGYVHERFASMVGIGRDRLAGGLLADIVATGDLKVLESLLAGSGSAQAELRLCRANGETLQTLASISPLGDERVIVFKDLSKEKRHSASDDRMRAFLSILAEEFGDMLDPVATCAEKLQREASLEAEERREAADTIARQVVRMRGVIEDLRRVNPHD